MTDRQKAGMVRYLSAVAIVLAATLVRAIADPILEDRQAFTVFLVAVIFAARFCGFAPSLLALFLGALASTYFFVSPRESLFIAGLDEQASFVFFILFGLLVAFLMRAEQRAKEEARQQAQAAVHKQQELEREIAVRNRIEAEAKESEVQLTLALNAGRLGIFSWNMTTNRVRSSETQAIIHGHSPDQTDLRLDESVGNLHPDDRHTMRDAIERVIRGEPPERITYRVLWPDESIHWIEAMGQVFCDELGTPTRLTGVCADITERKLADLALQAREAELRERQDELLLALDAARMGTWSLDLCTRSVALSETAEEMLGYHPGEFPGNFDDFLAAIHPDDRAGKMASITARLQNQTNRQHRHQFRVVWPDGRTRWLESQARTYFDSEGKPLRVLGVMADITERKQGEIALQESEERFRVLATKAPVGIFQTDSCGQGIFTNQRWCEMAGITHEEALGSGWKQAVHPTDLLRIEKDWTASVEAGRESADEFQFIHKGGEIVWGLATAAAVKDAEGQVTSFVGIVLDVTERKEAEEKLQARESQLTGILDNTSAVIYLKDSEGRYLLTNRSYEKLILRDGDSLIGRTDSDCFPASIAQTFLEADAKVWHEQLPFDFEEVAPQADGLHTYRSVKFPVRDETGKMIALGGISTDISDLKEAHDSLKKERELLRNLIEAQEKEKQFLCHEFHDGLIQYAVGSLMSLEGYRDSHPPTEASPVIDAVIDNLRKGVDDGRRVIRGIRPAVLDDSGLEAALEDLIGQFSNSEMMVTSKCDPKIGRLPDSVQTAIYRIVQEALNNARHHSGTDVVRIELKKANTDLQLDIQDFGCGFDVESDQKQGFGLLGMRERVRLLGGECLLQSEQDVGTRISVRLPIPLSDAG